MQRPVHVPLTRDAFASFDSTLTGKTDTKNSRIDGMRLRSLFSPTRENEDPKTRNSPFLNMKRDKEKTICMKSDL